MTQLKHPMVIGLVCFSIVVAIVIFSVPKKLDVPQSGDSTSTDSKDSKSPVDTSDLINHGEIFIDKGQLADAGVALANRYTGEIRDPSSLQDLRAALLNRSVGGLAALQADLATLERSSTPQNLEIARLYFQIGTLLTYEGRFDEAVIGLGRSSIYRGWHGRSDRVAHLHLGCP